MATTTTKLNVAVGGDIIYQANNSDSQIAATFQTAPKSAYQMMFRVIAFRTDTYSVAGAYFKRALYRTDAAGVITQVSTTQSVAADLEDNANWGFNLQIVGTTIALVISGEGAPDTWSIRSDIQVVGGVPTS
jgi:hypothetical protein